jgi:hypothetical protein
LSCPTASVMILPVTDDLCAASSGRASLENPIRKQVVTAEAISRRMTAGQRQVRLRILDGVACGAGGGVVPRKDPGLDNKFKQLDGT